MTLLDHREAPSPNKAASVARPLRSADATTIIAIFVVLQFDLPAKLAVNGLPLSLSAASLVALGLGVLWLCAQLTTTLGAAKGRSPVRTMLFTYSLVLLASYGNSSAGYLPQDERAIGDHTMVTLFATIIVAFAVCDGVRSRERIYFLIQVMIVCGTFVAVVGIVQYLFHYDPTPHLRPPGMHFTEYNSSVLGRDGLRRVAGTTEHPIEFGVFCAMMLPLAIHVAFRAKQNGRPSQRWWTCVVLIGAGLMFSVSRSAIVGLVTVGLVLFIGWSARRRVRMATAGLGFLVVIKFVSPGLLGTFLNLFRDAGSDDSISWRTHDYTIARQLIAMHPWLGRGTGTWYAPKHEVFDNQYLLTLVDCGVIGLVAFLAILFAALYAVLRVGMLTHRFHLRLRTPSTDRDLALAIGASVAAVFPTYATFDFGAFATVSSLTFLLVGIAGALLRIVTAEVSGEPADPYAIV